MGYEYQTLRIRDLHLRPDNPRNVAVEPLENQTDAMNQLVDVVGHSKLRNLAKDIVTKGMLNPADPIIVTFRDSIPIVLEGNRRIAAIKMVDNPELVHDLTMRRQLQEISDLGAPPAECSCLVFDTEDEARSWIALKHTGENGGVGTVQWGALQVQRFSGRPGTQSAKAMEFVDTVRSAFPDEEALGRGLTSVLNDKSTNLGRLISTPEVRTAMGFTLNRGAYEILDSDKLLQMLKVIVEDFQNDIGVSSIHSKDDRLAYITGVEKRQGPSSAASQSSNSSESKVDEPTAPTKQKNPSPTEPLNNPSPQPISEEGQLFEGVVLTNMSVNVSKLIRSAQRLRYSSDPVAIGILTRVILEFALDEAYEQLPIKGMNPEYDNLNTKLTNVLKFLEPSVQTRKMANTELGIVYHQAEQSHLVTSLHGFVHWIGAQAAPANMRHLSRILRPLLIEIDKRIGDFGSTNNNPA